MEEYQIAMLVGASAGIGYAIGYFRGTREGFRHGVVYGINGLRNLFNRKGIETKVIDEFIFVLPKDKNRHPAYSPYLTPILKKSST
jgi:hypothetical protein